MSAALEARKLSKSFGPVRALHELDLSVSECDGDITFDRAALLQAAYAFEASARRQAQRARQCLVLNVRVFLQTADEFEIDRVEARPVRGE